MSPGAESSPVFKDHFSDNSADYATYRPAYPEELFAWLAAQATGRERAWDLDRLEGYLAHLVGREDLPSRGGSGLYAGPQAPPGIRLACVRCFPCHA